ncbi:hypothetical protein CXG50_12270 [Pseudomonas plecoglossicida]|uniref:Uncharacterized protein n=1 Tax=Pseudomonas putida TaxID=303 RepID=A0ABD7BI66_PSEPU|nr:MULTISPECIES: hypothetical protein [Pseudomonas]MCE0757118.1 hypothetical protein [Pseudomonas asiatica]MCE1032754.1 hypothetical protein [Pseudomonas asiatica]MCE1067453.1 hypothetical protein [Pseudomonas asiatica]PLU99917.1 hypothetical protein CXG52_06735 [Pseudomonas plecoglossicida]PLV09177.1 hypothetical protein CXG50_12270 [Pseudomonas plecoglossicida]
MNQRYIGTKIILALAMTRLAYNEYRGWDLPADENGADEGYLVEYQDGGKPNHPDHAGYISWSPKEQFDAAYLPIGNTEGLAPHQIRVVAEKAQLDDKIGKLSAFFDTDVFKGLPDKESELLTAQLGAMREYSDLLAERIALF